MQTQIENQIANLYQVEHFTPESIAAILGVPVRDVHDITDECDVAEKDAATDYEMTH